MSSGSTWGAASGGRAYDRHITYVPDDDRANARLVRDAILQEQGRGIVDVPGIERPKTAEVGIDDPTGDDIAADAWRGR